MKYKGRQSGFSLVELSIVLVILGLLVGGILGGQSLIRAAELRAVTKEAERYTTAVNTFRIKYFGLPGDLANATKFWGAEPASHCPGDETTPSTTQATCNGNGDGKINWYVGAGYGGESHRFWQHLSNAGLIEGRYTGTHTAGTCASGGAPGNCNIELGVDAPASKLSGAGWSISNVGTVDVGHIYYFPGEYGNIFYFGRVGNFTTQPAVAPAEAWNIDTKIDDGMPGSGWIRSWHHTHTANCADSDDPDTAVYQVDIDDIGCQLVVKSGF